LIIGAHRFEVPNCYRHLSQLQVRYATWDLNLVHLVDEHTGAVLCQLFPQNKVQNASRVRRPLEPVAVRPGAVSVIASVPNRTGPIDLKSASGVPPLLSKLLAQQAATGLPPPYLPMDEPVTKKPKNNGGAEKTFETTSGT